jgi:tRNA A37 threonylcarbamoyladenosine dehydratase
VIVNPFFQRLALITGSEALDALAEKRVIVFGLGGVGSWCAEALVRSGLGRIDLVDSDLVCVTNINRQVEATSKTVGLSKAETLKERLLEINPRCAVRAYGEVYSRKTSGHFDIPGADYVIDAIDSVSCKLDLIEAVSAAGTALFSSMGMAQKLDPTRLKTAGIWETSGCPLARIVRQGLRKRGFAGTFTVVYSDEQLPVRTDISVSCGASACLCPARTKDESGRDFPDWCSLKKIINGSAVTVTATAGMILASLVIRDIARAPDG